MCEVSFASLFFPSESLNISIWNTDFGIHMTVHRDKFLIINQLDALISQIYFRNETLHVSGNSSVHHQEFSLYTQQWYMSYRFADSLWAGANADGQRNCPKHVEFNSKNKFEKLVHLVGFIIRNLKMSPRVRNMQSIIPKINLRN